MSRVAFRSSGFTLVEILVVMTIIAALAAAASIMIPIGIENSRKTACSKHLKELGGAYLVRKLAQPGAPAHSGSALLLSWRKEREIVREGQEELLLCPGDPHAVYPRNDADRARWDDVDLSDPSDDLCSYAVRDFRQFPLEKGSGKIEIIACDRHGVDGVTAHHDGGLNVLYDDGSTKFLDRVALGLDAKESIVVGPDTDHSLLSVVAR